MTKLSIMQDKGSWVFNDEQIIKIKHFSVEDINKFYFDNYKIFLNMAKKFVRQKAMYGNFKYDYRDLMQQIYVDLPYYNYSSRAHLYYGIVKGSFLRCYDGGVLSPQEKFISGGKMLSIDTPINDNANSNYLIDNYCTFEDPLSILEEIKEREQKDKQIISFLEKTIKNKKDLNKMFCQIFTDIPLSQIKGDEYGSYKQRESKIM